MVGISICELTYAKHCRSRPTTFKEESEGTEFMLLASLIPCSKLCFTLLTFTKFNIQRWADHVGCSLPGPNVMLVVKQL